MRWHVYFGKGICSNTDDLIYVEEIGKLQFRTELEIQKKGGCFLHIKEADNSHSLAGTAMERTRKNSNEKGKNQEWADKIPYNWFLCGYIIQPVLAIFENSLKSTSPNLSKSMQILLRNNMSFFSLFLFILLTL